MAKSTDTDDVAALKREVAEPKRRVGLLELYADSERREREGWTLDDIRAAWRKDAALKPRPVERGV